MTAATLISLMVALLGAVAGGFKIWSAYLTSRQASNERATGGSDAAAKINKDSSDAERRAAEASTNAPSGSQLDDDLASGRRQF